MDAYSHINTIFSLIQGEHCNANSKSMDYNQNCDIFEHIRSGNLKKVKQILQSSSISTNPNFRNLSYNGRTILQEACIHKQLPILKLLLETKSADIDLNKKSYVGEDTALHFAVCGDSKLFVEVLLKNGANPNQRNKFGATPLHYVQSKEVADLLHFYGADTTLVNNDGLTPMKYILKNGDHCENGELIRYLIQAEELDENMAFQRELQEHRRMKTTRSE